MDRDPMVHVSLTGSHSLGTGGTEKACQGIGRLLSKSSIPYAIHSPATNLGLPDRDDGSRERIKVKIEGASFGVDWAAQFPADAPSSMAGVVNECLNATGEVLVRASVTVDRVPVHLPRVGDGSREHKFRALLFELEPPNTAQKTLDEATPFTGLAMPSGEGTANVLILFKHKSKASDLMDTIKYALAAISRYCGRTANERRAPGSRAGARDAVATQRAHYGDRAGHRRSQARNRHRVPPRPCDAAVARHRTNAHGRDGGAFRPAKEAS